MPSLVVVVGEGGGATGSDMLVMLYEHRTTRQANPNNPQPLQPSMVTSDPTHAFPSLTESMVLSTPPACSAYCGAWPTANEHHAMFSRSLGTDPAGATRLDSVIECIALLGASAVYRLKLCLLLHCSSTSAFRLQRHCCHATHRTLAQRLQ